MKTRFRARMSQAPVGVLGPAAPRIGRIWLPRQQPYRQQQCAHRRLAPGVRQAARRELVRQTGRPLASSQAGAAHLDDSSPQRQPGWLKKQRQAFKSLITPFSNKEVNNRLLVLCIAQALCSVATLIHDTYLPVYLQDVLGLSNTKVRASVAPHVKVPSSGRALTHYGRVGWARAAATLLFTIHLTFPATEACKSQQHDLACSPSARHSRSGLAPQTRNT